MKYQLLEAEFNLPPMSHRVTEAERSIQTFPKKIHFTFPPRQETQMMRAGVTAAAFRPVHRQYLKCKGCMPVTFCVSSVLPFLFLFFDSPFFHYTSSFWSLIICDYNVRSKSSLTYSAESDLIWCLHLLQPQIHPVIWKQFTWKNSRQDVLSLWNRPWTRRSWKSFCVCRFRAVITRRVKCPLC